MPFGGKTARDESFPVASRLLSRARREQVLAFYRFARHADDIADSRQLSTPEKLSRLEALDSALIDGVDPGPARALREAVDGTPATIEPARHMLQAFRQDALGKSCETWSDLILYCTYSAVPVGRFLLQLHGEGKMAFRPADALCTAHQILNHLQDCGDDFRMLNRVYIPKDLLPDRSLLADTRTVPALRMAIDACIDRVDNLLSVAASLPDLVGDRALAGQAAATVVLGRRLAGRLRRQDPLAGPVRPGRLDLAAAAVTALRCRFA